MVEHHLCISFIIPMCNGQRSSVTSIAVVGVVSNGLLFKFYELGFDHFLQSDSRGKPRELIEI